MDDSSDLCRKCGGNLWMHTREQLQTCGVVPDPKGEEIAKLTRERDDAVKRFESIEAFLNATWLTCWAKGVGDLPDREPPVDIEDAARDVSTFILGCKEQISSLLSEITELRASVARWQELHQEVVRTAAPDEEDAKSHPAELTPVEWIPGVGLVRRVVSPKCGCEGGGHGDE